MLKKIGYALLVVIALVAIGGLILWNLPAENVAKKSVDFTIDATVLFEEYSNNEKAGNAKYVSKIILVRGTIEDITTDQAGAKVILIQGDDMGSGVLCTLETSENSKVAQFKRGDAVKIKGRCTGILMDVVLNNCTIQ